jgi:hypothetical protein
MLPRPFDGEPERWFWLHGRESAERDVASVFAISSSWGRGRPHKVGVVGALPAMAEAFADHGVATSVHDPDLQRIAAFQLRSHASSRAEVEARTSGLSQGLDAVVAPGCVLSHYDDDLALHEHLDEASRALRRGGVYVAEVWHPRLIDPDTGPVRPQHVRAFGTLPGGRARYQLEYGPTPPPHMNLLVSVERTSGLPLAASTGQVRLLTLSEWRAQVRATRGLEEAALLGPLDTRRTFHPEFGDRCSLVLVRTG